MAGTAMRARGVARRVARRALLRDLARRGGVGLAAGATLGAAGAAASILLGRSGAGWWIVAAAPAACAIAAVVISIARHWSIRRAAIHADHALRLHDRISTALAIDPRASGFAAWAVEQGESAAGEASAARVVSLRPSGRAIGAWIAWLGLTSASVAALLALPGVEDRRVDRARVAMRDAAAAEIADTAAALREAIETTAEADGADELDPAQVEALEELHRQLVSGQVEPDVARARAAEQAERVAQELARAAEKRREALDAARERLARAADAVGDSESSEQGPADAVREALAAGDLDAARDAMEQIARDVERLSPEERRRLADDLSRLARAIEREAAPRAGDRAREPGEIATEPDANNERASDSATETRPEVPESVRDRTDPEEIARELERQGADPESADRVAQQVARENRRKEAEREGERQANDLGRALDDAARELRGEPPPDPPQQDRTSDPAAQRDEANERSGEGDAKRTGEQGDQKQQGDQERQGDRQREDSEGSDRDSNEGAGERSGDQQGQRTGERRGDRTGEGGQEQGDREGGGEREDQQGREGQSQREGQAQGQGRDEGQKQGQRQGVEEGREQGAEREQRVGEGAARDQQNRGERGPGDERASRQERGAGDEREGQVPEPRGVEGLRRSLDRLSRGDRRADDDERRAREWQDHARRLIDGSSPEELERLRQWSRHAQREGSMDDEPTMPGSPGAGEPTRVRQVPREWSGATEDVDARGEPPPGGRRLIADLLPDERGERPGDSAAMGRAIRDAAEGAQRAIEQQAVPQRYSDLVRRVFRRYTERAPPP